MSVDESVLQSRIFYESFLTAQRLSVHAHMPYVALTEKVL